MTTTSNLSNSDQRREPSSSVLIVRHGQSEWNAVRRWQGTADPPLTELGREQARRAARQLLPSALPDQHTISGVWASDLERAAETAAIIAEVLGVATVTLDARFQEAHAGEWEGLTPAEIEQAWPGWLAEERRPPTFEPFDRVVARVVEALDDVVRASSGAEGGQDGSPLVVSHSGVIRSLVRWSGGNDRSIPNLGGRWFQVDVNGGVDPNAIDVVGEFAPDLERTGESMPENPAAPKAPTE